MESSHVYIPAFIMAKEDLTVFQKLIYGKIAGLCNHLGVCTSNNETLAEQTTINPRTIIRHLNVLIAKGYIKRELSFDTHTNLTTRTLTPYITAQNAEIKAESSFLPQERGGVTNCHGVTDCQGVTDCHGGVKKKITKGLDTTTNKQDSNALITNNQLLKERKDIYIYIPKKESKSDTKSKELPSSKVAELNDFLEKFNKLRKSHYRTWKPFSTNYWIWRESYSMEDILKAVWNAQFDSFWKDVISPETLLRTRNSGGECDNIGKLLSIHAQGAAR